MNWKKCLIIKLHLVMSLRRAALNDINLTLILKAS